MADALAAAYPEADCELDHTSPFTLLVATVLSAQSTDRRVNGVTVELFRRYPGPEALAGADVDDVAAIIKPVGFYRNKAAAIQGLSRIIVDEHDGEVPADLDALVRLPGVGRKTANVVLGNAFGIPGVTPDTHLIRLANRFEWVDSTKPDTVERAVMALVPSERWTKLSHEMIWHGRRVCHARRPACGACVIRELCPSNDIGEQDPDVAASLIREPRG
ncbi:MAG: endonuclease III [Propionibacterium sp.]|nr:endonuclease III [Propionibacterium sp.]